MPKTYSEQEREYIDKRLREEAMNCMAAYGIRKTTVDELVRRVRIPKDVYKRQLFCTAVPKQL